MKVKVSRVLCLRCGSCEALCPDIFVVKTDGVHLRKSRIPLALRAACQSAAEVCPVDAITLLV
jgi:ferredoxin